MNDQEKISTIDLDRLQDLLDLFNKAKEGSREAQSIKLKLMDFFREQGIKTFKYKNILIRFTEGRETNEFDVHVLMDKYPEIWKECHSLNYREPHISIKKINAKKDEDSGEPTEEEIAESMAAMSES